MKFWNMVLEFIDAHGIKLIYMSIATFFGFCFIKYLNMPGEGKTILIAVATLALNTARGGSINGKPKTT